LELEEGGEGGQGHAFLPDARKRRKTKGKKKKGGKGFTVCEERKGLSSATHVLRVPSQKKGKNWNFYLPPDPVGFGGEGPARGTFRRGRGSGLIACGSGSWREKKQRVVAEGSVDKKEGGRG